MWISWLGTAVAGLMWGWLAADHAGYSRRAWLSALAVIAATLLLGAAIAWKVGRIALFFFLGAAFLAFCVQLEWRRLLRLRSGS